MRDYSQHSTSSPGKEYIVEKQKELWVPGPICATVGSGLILSRHVNEYRNCNIDTIYVYELVKNTFWSLVDAKNEQYPLDKNILIIPGDIANHNFKMFPVNNFDMDVCCSWLHYFDSPTSTTGLDFINKSKVESISFTFSQRGINKQKLNLFGDYFKIKKNPKKLVTLYHTENKGYYYEEGYDQKDVAKALFSTKFPKYTFETYSYKGLNPMLTISGKLR